MIFVCISQLHLPNPQCISLIILILLVTGNKSILHVLLYKCQCMTFSAKTSSTYKWIQLLICTSSWGMMGEKLDVSGNFQHKCFCDLYSYKNMVDVKGAALFLCQEQHLFQSFSVAFMPLAAGTVVCMDPVTSLIA